MNHRTLSHFATLVISLVSLVQPSATQAHIHRPFDINSDTHEDFIYQDPDTGIVRVTTVSSDGLRGTSSHSLGGRTTEDHRILGTGDFDGDGQTDLLWRRPHSATSDRIGFWYINAAYYTHDRSMEADTVLTLSEPELNKVAAIGDVNGDGYSDLIFHRSNTTGGNPGGVFYWTIGPGGTRLEVRNLAQAPYDEFRLIGAADFNADGISDLLFHNKNTGDVAYWHLQSTGNGATIEQVGNFAVADYSDWRVVGISDMDDDGRSDLLFHQKSTGAVAYWLINNSGTGIKSLGNYSVNMPVDAYRILGARDFDGDNRADVLFQERSTGLIMYWILDTLGGGTATIAHGDVYAVLDARKTHFPGSSDYFDGYTNTPDRPAPTQSYPAASAEPVVEGTVAMYARHSGNGRTEGWYDGYSNRTFTVYAGCDSDSADDICYSHPTLSYYDHNDGEWHGPYRIADNPFYTKPGDPTSGPLADAHTYPEILVDAQHRIHIFHAGHVHELKHWVSKIKTNSNQGFGPAQWTEAPFSFQEGFKKATYVKVFKDKYEGLWVLWRYTEIGVEPPGDPCQVNEFDIYETWMYSYSSDGGNYFQSPTKLFEPEKGDTWDTVYLDAIKYDPDQHRLHLTFRLTRFHNCYYDKFFYAYRDLSNGKMYAPTGANLGSMISQTEMENASYKMAFFEDGEQAFRSHQTVIGIDRQGRPHIFHTNYNDTSRTRITHRYWTGSSWSQAYTLQPNWDDRWLRVLDVSFSGSQNKYWLYVTWSDPFTDAPGGAPETMLSRLTFGSYSTTQAGSQKKILGFTNPDRMLYEASLITNRDSDAVLMINEGLWRGWSEPKSDGCFYVWGNSGFLNPGTNP